METQEIVNFLNGSDNENSKFPAKKMVCQKVFIHKKIQSNF